MTKKVKRYSGRIASTAVVAAALGLIIWALIAFAAGSVTTDKTTYHLGDTIVSTLAGGTANRTYYAEYWGPTVNGGTAMMRNYSAVVTTNGSGGATSSYTTSPTKDHTGTWTARYTFNPNYSRPQYVSFDIHSSVWLGNTRSNLYYGFKLVDRLGRPILTDQSANIICRLQYGTSTVTGWSDVNPTSGNGWNFNSATGVYSKRDTTSRSSSSTTLRFRVGAATSSTYMPGSGTAETGDPATFSTNMRYSTQITRVNTSQGTGYPCYIVPLYTTNNPVINPTPNGQTYNNFTYYFDIVGPNGSYLTATTSLSVTTATAYRPLSSGNSTTYNSGSFTYTGGHFRVQFNLPETHKYGVYLNITRGSSSTAWSPNTYQIINYASSGNPLTMLPGWTPPGPVQNLSATPGDRKVDFSWTNPDNPPGGTFKGVMVLRASVDNNWTAPTNGSTYPVGGNLGNATVVYNADSTANQAMTWTNGESCNTSNMLQTGTVYYYKVYTYDTYYAYSNTGTTTGGKAPVDSTAPQGVTNAQTIPSDRLCVISWTPSTDCDYNGVRIYASIDGSAAPLGGGDGYRLVGETTGYKTGGTMTFTDSPLTNGLMQFYTIWAKDDDGNWSSTYATASGVPQDYVKPGQITDLTITNTGAFTADLRWTAVADNGANALSGNASGYEIRYYKEPITSSNWDQAWLPGGAALPQPASSGTIQTYKVTGLSPMHDYYFAIRAKDEVPNWSDISNTPSTTTLCNPELSGCDQCHQLPPTDGLPGQHPRATGNIGAHNIPIHAQADPNQCNTCHANGNVFRNNSLIYAYNHQNFKVDMNYSGMIGNLEERQTRTGGTWKPYTTIVYKFREFSGTTPYRVVTGNCVNTYCHGVGKGASASPLWGLERVTCGEYCHEAPPATGRHIKHYHPGAYYINFGPSGIPEISGYSENDGSTGWTGTTTTHDNGNDPQTGGNVDERYATYIASSNATLELTGLSTQTTYYLTTCCGDSSTPVAGQTVQVSPDGGATWYYVGDSNNWDTTEYKLFRKEVDFPITVAVGHTSLLVRIGNGADVTKLNFLILNSTPEAPKSINTVLANTPSEYGFACGKCHSNDVTQARHANHVNGAYQPGVRHAEVVFDGNSFPKNPLGNYTDIFGNPTSKVDGQGFLYTTGPRCTNLYCHGETLGAGGSNTEPFWRDGYIDVQGASICGTCHDTMYADSTPATNIATGSHNEHVSAGIMYQLDCYKCHNNTVNPRRPDGSLSILDKTHHVNGDVDVAFDRHDPTMQFGRYSTSQHTCYNVYCHSNGLVDASNQPYWATTYATPTWGLSVATCHFCHGTTRTAVNDGMPDYANNTTTPNSHPMHVDVNHQKCATCHFRSIEWDNATIKPNGAGTLHVDGEADVFFAPTTVGAGASYSHVTRYCNNTYCHGYSAPPKWGASRILCGDCHGNATAHNPTPPSGRHDAHTLGNHTDITAPTANNSSGGSADFTCSFCHYSRSHATGPVSGTVTAETNFSPVDVINAYNLSGGVYSPGASMTPEENGWAWTDGTCANVLCHSDGRGGAPNVLANWTTPLGGLGCFGCHGGTDGEPVVLNTGKHLMHVSESSSKKNCDACHADTCAGNSIKDASRHVNGVVNVAIATGGTYDNVGHDCNNVYCHSNGNPGYDRGATNYYPPTPDWVEASSHISCTGCHSDNHYADPGDGVRPAGGTLSYNHQRHLSAPDAAYPGYGTRFGCANCHNSVAASNASVWPSSPNHADGYKDVTFWTASTAGTGPRAPFRDMTGTNTRNPKSAYWGTYAVNDTSNGVNISSTCTVICHSDGRGGNPNRFPNWSTASVALGGTYGCNSCHGYDTATYTNFTTFGHRKHAGVNFSAMECNLCHRLTVSGAFGSSFVNASGYATNHVNGNVEVAMALSVGGAYNTTTKTCSNTICHGSISPDWRVRNSTNCASCHNSPPKYAQHFGHYSSTLGNTTTTSNYTRNLTVASAYKFGCGKCHLSTGIRHGTGQTETGKVNQIGEIAFDSGTAPANPLGSYTTTDELFMNYTSKGRPWTNTKGTCRNLYCHSDGKATPTYYAMVNWSTTAAGMTCSSCHNSADTYANMTTAMVPTTLSRSHAKHAATDKYTFTCNLCHKQTVSSSTVISRKNNHVNGSIQVYMPIFGGRSGFYVPATKSCRGTYCHSDGNTAPLPTAAQIIWTDKATCVSCHAATVGQGLSITTGKHGNHVGNGDLANFGCVACHDATVVNDNTISNFANHVNGVKDVYFQTLNNMTGGYASASKTCRNNYCHSSGQAASAADGTPTYSTPTWTDAAWSKTCNGCHGKGNGYGAPDYANISTADRAQYNSHLVPGHVNSSRDCIHCHMHTVDSFGNITTGSTQHINGSREVVFQLAGSYDSVSKTCTNVPCHGYNTTPLRWGGTALNCTNCHADMGAGFSAQGHVYTGNHQKHTDPATYKFACEICHATKNAATNVSHGTGYVSSIQAAEMVFNTSTTFWRTIRYKNNTALRYRRMDTVWNIIGNTNVSYAAGGTQAGIDPVNGDMRWTFGQCSNVWCHSNGQSSSVYAGYLAWTTVTTNCVSCHGDKNSGTLSAKHGNHVSNGLIASFGCAACHKATVSDDTTISNFGNHVNGMRDVSFQAILGNATGGYNGTSNTCRNNYCHSSGQRVSMTNTSTFPMYRTPTWTEPAWATTCNKCHGTGTAYGQPDYQNRNTASGAWLNSHMVAGHVSSAGDCIHCHRGTVDSFGNLTTGTTQHINGAREVSFQKGGTYDPANKSCSDTDADSCHGATTVSWGSSAGCAVCHQGASDVDDNVYGNSTRSVISYVEYTSVGHGKIGKYRYNSGNNNGAANPSWNSTRNAGTCSACHDSTVPHNSAGNIYRVKVYTGPKTVTDNLCGHCHDASEASHHDQANVDNGNATWYFTPKCVDCHDPHGDSDPNNAGRMNYAMIQSYVNYSTASSDEGVPTFTKAVSFPANATLPAAGNSNLNGDSYTTADFKGICQICHTAGGNPNHYSRDMYDTTHSTDRCSLCHTHSHGFKGSGACTGCHAAAQGARRNIQTDFGMASHHITGSWAAVTTADCAACHAEGDYATGDTNTLHTGKPGHPVYLKKWTGAFPGSGSNGTYDVISTTSLAANSSVLTPFCLGCHNETNKNSTPFHDGNTPVAYSWDNNSVDSKFSNVSTTPWGKFDSSAYNVVPADIVPKAFSPHGNAKKNYSVMSIAGFSTYSSSKAVGCYDCHNSHSSTVSGGTSYTPGNTAGGNFKTTATYTPTAGGSTATKNLFSASSALCFDCHFGDNSSAPKKYTDYGIPQGMSIAGSYYDRVGATSVWSNWSTSRWSINDTWRGSFAYKDAKFAGGHFGSSRGYLEEGTPGKKINSTTTGGTCAACHDPHGVSPAIKRGYTKPVRTVYNGSGADPVLSGTYSGAANASYICVFQIVGGGTKGTATYRASTNGGKTWGSTTSTASSGADWTANGISLTLGTGTYAADDTWTFLAGANPNYMVPALKGTWMHSPYKEDRAPRTDHSSAGNRLASVPRANDFLSYSSIMGNRRQSDLGSSYQTSRMGRPAPRMAPDFEAGSYIPGYNIPAVQGDGFGQGPLRNYGYSFSNITAMRGWNGYYIDDNTFGIYRTYSKSGGVQITWNGGSVYQRNMTTVNPAATPGNFSGLCLQCHAWSKNNGIGLSNVTSATVATGNFRQRTMPHDTVMGMGTASVNIMRRAENYTTVVSSGLTYWGTPSTGSDSTGREYPMFIHGINATGTTNSHTPGSTYGGTGVAGPVQVKTDGTTSFGIGTGDGQASTAMNQAKYYRWGLSTGQRTAGTIQGTYHRFPCAKCHTPHVSRLPRLLKTNCLDNNGNNTFGGSYVNDAHSYTNTNNQTTRQALWGALFRNMACHSTKIGAVNQGTRGTAQHYQPGGWNNKSPW